MDMLDVKLFAYKVSEAAFAGCGGAGPRSGCSEVMAWQGPASCSTAMISRWHLRPFTAVTPNLPRNCPKGGTGQEHSSGFFLVSHH
jgi:hypothetical protein